MKPALDVGFQIAATDPSVMLAYYRDVIGVHFDHDLPLGGGRMQSRHTWGDSVIKLNHRRDAVPHAPATGWSALKLLGPGASDGQHRPGRNVVARAPAEVGGRRSQLTVRDARASLAFFAALGLPLAGERIGVGASAIRVRDDRQTRATPDSRAGPCALHHAADRPRRPGACHVARSTQAPRGKGGTAHAGTVARISFVVEPGGNWIELSQRASIVGSLDT